MADLRVIKELSLMDCTHNKIYCIVANHQSFTLILRQS